MTSSAYTQSGTRRPLRLAILAAATMAMGLTAGQLSRICREVLGISALDVINARLVHEAQRELVYTASSVKLLASELGFDDDAYFSRFFKRHTGLSPSEFRAQALAQFAEPTNP